MKILRPVDIENEIREALKDYITAYVRPLPDNFSVPNTLIVCAGGNSSNTVDKFTVALQTRAETDAEALELMNTTIGILESQTQSQVGALRYVELNSLASWGSDPVRPDLKLCTATVIITAHREQITIPES